MPSHTMPLTTRLQLELLTRSFLSTAPCTKPVHLRSTCWHAHHTLDFHTTQVQLQQLAGSLHDLRLSNLDAC